MTDNIQSTFSFWQLINRYKIEIPIIQRDYAQGRKDEKAESIRKQIIDKMLCALSDKGEPLSFDFVYGRVADGVFLPIDGQQRLTTLWLLHVYLLNRCVAQQTDFCGKECLHTKSGTLNRFTYATRQSSREFCEKLVEEDFLPCIGDASGYQDQQKEVGPVQRHVTNQSWFYPDWAYDPTVAGMLRTLDEIHSQMNLIGVDAPELLSRLFSNSCPISFKFLDMGALDLSDDLYLKMNARGLPLTEYENFKASLEQYLGLDKHYDAVKAIADTLEPKDGKIWEHVFSSDQPREHIERRPKIKIAWKLEHDWHELFWNKNTPDPIITERDMLSVFRRHFLNVWRLNNSDDETSKTLVKLVNGFSFTPFSVYETVLDKCSVEPDKCGIGLSLKPIVNLFESLAIKQLDLKTKPAWGAKLWNPLDDKYEGNDKPEASYASRVRFYAVSKCFLEPFDDTKNTFEDKYKEWMRVVWNILEEASVNNDNFQSSLKCIDELGKHWHDILNWLANPDNEIKTDWAKEQIYEEVEKARLLVADTKWKHLIEKGEEHYIFKGSLRFLMHGKNWEQIYEQRLNRAISVFGDGAKDSRVFAFRAFVSRFKEWGIFWYGLKYDAKPDSWREVLRVPVRKDVEGRICPLYEVLDTVSDETLHAWLKDKSALPRNSGENEKAITAHEVLFQTNVIGNCSDGAELRWKDCYYALIPRYASADWKKVVLDKRHLDLRKLHDVCPPGVISGLDFHFHWDNKRNYVWWRDGNIYAWDCVSNSPNMSSQFVVDENGSLIGKTNLDTILHTDLQTTTIQL